MFAHNTVIDTSVQADVGFVTLHLRDWRVIICPRLLTDQALTKLLNLPSVILRRVASLGNGQSLNISRMILPDNTLHHLSGYIDVLLANREWMGRIEQLYEGPR